MALCSLCEKVVAQTGKKDSKECTVSTMTSCCGPAFGQKMPHTSFWWSVFLYFMKSFYAPSKSLKP